MSETIDGLLAEFEGIPETHPLVILGQMERVGSNFYLDILEQTHLAHNEPYKQLVPESWPIARGYAGELTSIDEFFASPAIADVHKLWLKNFVVSRYQPEQQVIKETNLYFALPNLLELFPYRRTEVLTRHPLGIVSSFKRSDLFNRWNYEHVVDTLKMQAESKERENFRGFFVDSDSWEERLVWLIGLNATLLSRHVEEPYEVVRYDNILHLDKPQPKGSRPSGSIFGTNIVKERDDFDEKMTALEIERLRSAAKYCIEYVHANFEGNELFDQIYTQYFDTNTRTEGVVPTRQEPKSLPIVSADNVLELDEQREQSANLELCADQDILWSRALVTNAEMHAFLNELLVAGLDSDLLYLLLRHDMPADRGGRLNYDEVNNQLNLLDGYENHPAYWITWLGAAMYALHSGQRLPTSEEYQHVFDAYKDVLLSTDSNHSYQHDDTVPTGSMVENLPADFFGNLKVWCADWSEDIEIALSKRLGGISWKHYLHDEYKPLSEKPFLTNSRVIGLRLVTDKNVALEKITPSELLAILNDFMQSLHELPILTTSALSNSNRLLSERFFSNDGHPTFLGSHASEVA